MSITIAIVLNVSGKAWAEAPDGSRRALEQGDGLMVGERLITAEDARVLLDFGYDNTATVDGGLSILASTELANNFIPSPEDSNVEDESVTQALAAIEEALGTSLEEAEAPAAGLEGGSAGGSSSVRLARILESINPSDISLDLATAQADTPAVDIEGGSGLTPTDPEPGVLSIDSVSGGTSDTPAYTVNGSGNNLANGESITVTITDQNGTTVSQVISPGPDGSYTAVISQLTGLVDGPVTIDASATGANGERTTASTEGTLDVTTGTLDVTTQSIDNDAQTIDLAGTTTDVAAGNAVELTITDTQGTVVTATATVSADGSFSIAGVDLSGLVDGSLTIEASAQDRNGNQVSDLATETYDATPGGMTVIVDVIDDGAQTLDLSGSTTDVSPNSQVDVTITDSANNSVTTSVIVGADGSFNVSGVDISGLVDGNLTVEASAQDRNGNNVTDSASGTVNAVDDVPVISGDITGTVTEDDATILTTTGTLAANGGDPGEDAFTAETLTGTYGELVIGENGTWTYSADNNQQAIQGLAADQTLTDSFTVTNADGVTTETVTITINGTQDAPVANDDVALSTDEDTVLSNIDVLANDTDSDGDSLSVTQATATNGTVIINADGTLDYTPDANFAGNDTINYTVSDGNGGTDSASVAITVNPVNNQSSLSLTDGSATEDSTSAGAVISEITLTDEEGNATVDFTAGTNDNGYYEIVGNEVRLTSAGETYLDAGNTLPDVSLTTNDGVTATNTVTTTLVNDQSSLSLTDGTVTEDATSAGDVIGEITLTDEEGNATVDFTAGTNDDGYYEIVGNNVVLTAAGETYLDAGNALPDVSLTTNDGVTATNTVTTTLVNDTSTLSLTDGTVTEDATSAGDVIGQITLTDEEGNATVDFTAGTNDDGYYEIVGNEVRLTSAGETYLDAGNELPDVSLTTNDGVTVSNTVTTTLVNDTSTLSLTNGSVTEGSTSAGDVIGQITLTDEEGNATVDFTAGTNDAGYYEIVGNEVRLTSAGEAYLDAGNELPDVSLTTNDGVTTSNTVTTTLVNDTSTLSLTDGTATEDSTSAGDVISEITLTDEEGNATVDFTAGTNDDGYYQIVGNNVVLTATGETYLDAGNTLPNVSLTTNDGVTTSNTVTTTLVNDTSTLSLTDGSATEDSTSAGNVISEITLTDEEGNATVDFTAGTNDNGYYEIVGNEVRLTSAGETYLDAGNALPNVSLTTNDGVTATNTVTTTLVNDTSTLSLTDGSVTEDATSAGDVISEITLTDEEGNATVDFTAGTNDDGYYQIVGNNVVLTATGETYLDAGNTLPNVSLTTNDGVTATNTVTTTLVNDQSSLSLTDGSVTEDSTSAGAVIGEITLTDEEGNATVDFTAGTNDDGYYEIVGNEVRLTSAGETYLDAGNALPDVSLTTNDGVTATNTVTTTLVNDTSTLSLTDGTATEDSTSAGAVISEITLTDEEGNATVDFTAGTNDDGYYEIVGNEVRLTSAGEAYLDAGNELPDVSLTTNDGVTATNTVTTTLVNDTSTLGLTDGTATEDTTSAGDVIGEITLTDEEGNATVDFTAGTNDDGYYEIVGNNVVLTATGEAYLDAGNALPNVSLTTNDGVTATNTVTTTLVNDTSTLSLTDGLATEDSTSAGDVISEITLTDEEGNATVDFTAGTNDDGYYEIVGNEVRLTSAGETYLDAGNALPDVSLTTNDGVTATNTVTTTLVNDTSTLSLTDGSVTEDSTSAGDVIGEITLTDEEGNATVDFTAGTNDNGYYEIVGNEVRLTSAGETYLDAGNALPDVSLTTNDGVTATNTVTTTLVNDTSTLSLTDGSVTEDSTSAGDVIGEITLTDEEGNATVDFTAGTNDNGYYEIVGNEVRLTSAGETYLDAGNALPDVSLTTNDGVTATNTVTTTLVNDTSTLSLTDGTATEDSTSAGAVISEITLTDEEGNATVDFTAGTNDAGYYEIVGNEVRLTSAGETYLDAGNTLPNVSLTTNDGVTATNTVTTTLVNDTSTLSLTDGSVTEDSTSAGDVIGEITLTDEEGNATVDFTAGTNDNGYYEIVGNEVRLTSAGETYLDAGNALPDVSLTTNDGVTATNTVTTTLVNDTSTLSLTDGTATEDSTSAGAVISEITLTDEEGNATVDFTAGTNDAGYYEIVGNEVRLTSAGETYLDAGNTLPNVSLTTNDGVTATNTVTTTLVNDTSTLSLTDGSVTEDSTSAGDVIGEITLTDEEGNATVDFTAGTNDDGYYEIVGNEVRLTSAGETYLDAGNTLPNVSLTTNDGVTATNTVTTTLVNDTSTLSLTDGTATEDTTSAGDVISEITLTDEEGNATVDFTAGTNDNGYYEIVGNEVRLTSAGETYLDAGNALPDVSLTTNDGVTVSNTVTTTLVNDQSSLSLTDGLATEDSTSAGDVISEITLTDEEGNATVDFTAGTNDNGYYEIVGNEVRLTSGGEAYLDAGNALPDVSLTTNDGVTQTNTVTTTLVNDTSTLSLTDGSATEDSTSAGDVIGEITLTDEEGNATVDFTAGTNDDGYYEIVGNEVRLTSAGETYLDAGNTLPNVSLTTNDGVTATNTVTTTLVNDTSTLSLTDGTATEDSTSAGDVIGEITLTDEEGNATVDFTAGTNDDGYYEIVGNEVRLTSAGEAYLDAGNTLPNISLTTNDGVTATNTVTTTLVNDQSSLSLTDGLATEDSTSAGDVISEITLTDEEGNATVDFTAGTNDNGYYEIVGNEVRLTSAGEAYLDAGNTLPNISLTTNDGVTATNTVTTTLVNDAPVANDDAALSTDEDTVLSNIDVLANDTDSDGDSLSVTQATATNGTVIINADGTLDYTPDADFAGNDTINYTVSDGQGGTDTATVTVDVKPVADAPTLTAMDATSVQAGETTISTGSSDIQVNPNTFNSGNGVSRDSLELELGLPNNFLNDRFDPNGANVNDPGKVTVVDGKITGSSQALTAGMGITWDYTFTNGEDLANEVSAGYNDLVVLVVTTPSGAQETLLVDSSENKFPDQTVNGTFTYSTAESGHHQFQWLVLNGRDANKDSSLSLNTPTVTAPGLAGSYGVPVDLVINAALADQDGSETLGIVIDGMPADAALTAGVENPDGTWSLGASDLDDLQLLPPAGFSGDIALTVTATATESGNNDEQSVTDTLTVTVDQTEVTVSGDQQDNTLQGTATDDLIRGYAGDDTLSGGAGNDYLLGGAGNDTLIGGTDGDVLTGGVGADVFRWELGDASDGTLTQDKVTDFTIDAQDGYTGTGQGDQLELTDLLQDASSATINDYMMAREEHGDTVLYLNKDGALSDSVDNAHQSITLSGVSMDGQTSDQFIDSLLSNNQIKIE